MSINSVAKKIIGSFGSVFGARNGNLLQELIRLEKNEVALHAASFMLGLTKDKKYADPRKLIHYENSAFSQNGEDGILQEIFRRIGTQSRHFVEIGVGDGYENCTCFLLLKGWTGAWLEGSSSRVEHIHKSHSKFISEEKLRIEESFVTRENVFKRVRGDLIEREADLLSIDVDCNTFHIWEALCSEAKPRAVVVEYNPVFPPPEEWIFSYRHDAVWDGSMVYGASLKSMELLGNRLGYHLVGCDAVGVNAFFVREDLCGDKFAGPFTAEEHYEPGRYFLSPKWNVNHQRRFPRDNRF